MSPAHRLSVTPLLGKALSRFGFAAVGLAVRTLGVLDAHLSTLRQPRIGVPEFGPAQRQRRGEALSRRDASL